MEPKTESLTIIQGIAQRLRAARERKNLSQSELSERAGLDRKTCAGIEKGKADRNIGVLTIERLARALDVSPAWLAFGQDDSEHRIAGLLQELVAIKKERLAQPVRTIDIWTHNDDEDGEDEDDEATDDEDSEAEDAGQAAPGAMRLLTPPVWPQGHRPRRVVYSALPPLGLHYRPVLDAIGPGLPIHRRKEIGQSLIQLLYGDERAHRREHEAWLRTLLLQAVPASDHPIVALVVQDLASEDQLVRGRMALSLIIDGGIPVKFRDLMEARGTPMPRQLYAALTCALEMLESLLDARSDRYMSGSEYILPACPIE